MNRLKTYDATGIAPGGRLFAGDLNALQDAVAALTDLAQNLSVGTMAIGESGLILSRFGAGEARISGALRTDGIVRGLGGLFGGAFTTTARDAISAGFRPFGLIILNTTTGRYEWNIGSDATPVWAPLGNVPSYGTSFPGSPVDGQEHILVDSTSAPTYQWRFRYNAGSGSTYKWEFIGGAALVIASSTTTLPKAGDWNITGKGYFGNGGTTTGNDEVATISVTTIGTIDTQVQNGPDANASGTGSRGQQGTALTGKASGAASGATVTMTSLNVPKLTIQPVRCI